MKNLSPNAVNTMSNPQDPVANIFAFGDFKLDVNNKKLLKLDKELRLEKRMFQLLCLLVEKAPDPISKDQLIDQLWKNQVVTEWSLSRLISDTRKILGDDGKSQKFIKTSRGKGFHFCGKIERVTSVGKPLDRRKHPSPSFSKKIKYYIFSFFLILLTLLGLYQYKVIKENNKTAVIKQLQENLIVTKIAHSAHDKRSYELTKLIDERIGVDSRLARENVFVAYYKQLNTNELFICEQIRTLTESSLYTGNKTNLKLLIENPELKNDLPSYQALINHLKFWLNKYENVYQKREDMCLITTGPDGVAFPKTIDKEIADWLAKN